MRAILRRAWYVFTHLWGRLSGTYFFEDYVRVYPDGVIYDRFGRRREPIPGSVRNFLNHQKFYQFASQFVDGVTVADIGCGSGYGCAVLKQEGGAARVFGADVSAQAIAFARERYGAFAEFSEQSITNLQQYRSESFDVCISSEVLEHIKEYRKEDDAVAEVSRVARRGGIIVFGTPNSEMCSNHGFWFEDIDGLMKRHFRQYCIFENALVPYGTGKRHWEDRKALGRVGEVVTQLIKLDETLLPEGVVPEIKHGREAGIFQFAGLDIDTRLLHNTHSWVIVAVKE